MAKVEILNENGAVASSADVMSNVAIDGTGDNAQLKVYSGGLVSGGSVTGAGKYSLAAGGTLENVTLNQANEVDVYGTFSGCTFSSPTTTRPHLRDGAHAYNCTVAAGARVDNTAGATGSGNLLYGDFRLNAGATYYDTTIYKGGALTLETGGTASGVVVSGGFLDARKGSLINVTMYSGTASLGSGLFASGMNVSGGTLNVASGARISGGLITGATKYSLAAGGVLENVTVNLTGGTPYYDVGTYSGCTFSSIVDYRPYLTGGAEVYNCTVGVGARVDVVGAAIGSGNQVYGQFRLGGGSGAVFSDTTIYQDTLILEGGTAHGVTVSGGTLQARSGGLDGITQYNGTVDLWGGMAVSGATVSGGAMAIGNSGTVTDLTLCGGTVSATVAAAVSGATMTGGTMYVSSAAVVSNLTMTGGSLEVYKGARISGGSITGAASNTISTDGVLENVTLNQTGQTAYYTRGTYSGCTFSNTVDYRPMLTEGAHAYNCTVAAGARVDVTGVWGTNVTGSGNQVSGTFRIGGNSNTVFSDTTVYQGGTLVVEGGTAHGVTVSGGSLDIRSGVLDNVTMYDGSIGLYPSFSASVMTISGGTMTINNSGTVTDLTLRGGTVTVLNGGTVSGTVVSGGTLKVSSAATATDVSLAGGAVTAVWTADVTATAGTLNYANGAVLVTNAADGEVLVSAHDVTLDGGNYTKAAIRNGSLTFQNQATAAELTVSGGTAAIAEATVSNVTLSAGTLNVSSAGTASAVTLNAGTLNVSSAGTVSNLTATGGSLNVSGGARVSGGSITGAATFRLSAGGVLENVTLNQTGKSVIYADGLFSGCTFQNSTDNRVVLYGASGAAANDCTVASGARVDVGTGATGSGNLLYGELRLAAGAVVSDTTVYQGGNLILEGSGTAHEVTVSSGGKVEARTGVVSGVTLYDARLEVSAAATVSDVSFNGGMLKVFNGATISDVTMTAGTLDVSSASIVSNLHMTGGQLFLISGTVISGGSITDNAGYSFVSGGGVLENVTVNLTGAKAYNTDGTYSSCTFSGTVDHRPMLTDSAKVYDCTVASGARLDANGANTTGSGNLLYGQFYCHAGTFTDTTINEGGYLTARGGTLNGIVVSGGSLEAQTGALNDVTMYGGTATISSGTAVMTNLTMSGGWMKVYGGTLNNWTLDGGVSTSVYGDFTLNGTITIAGQVYLPDSAKDVTITAGTATVIFDTVNYQSGINGMFYRLEKLQGANELRIAVSSASEVGSTYELTAKADLAEFNRSFNVYNGTTNLGYVTLNNTEVTSLVSGGKVYTLNPYLSGSLYKVQFQVLSSLVKDLAVTVDGGNSTITWNALNGGISYQVSVDGGTTWEDATGTSYTYTGTAQKEIQVRMKDTQGHCGDASKITVAGTAEETAVDTLVSNASAGATIVLRDGEYTSGGVITMKAGQTLEGQGTDPVSGTILTTVGKAIYGAGNAVTVKNLKASTNVAGGAVNAATSTDLAVESAQLKDAFAGSLVNSGTVEVASAGAELTGTTFRNLYGAGYATGSGNVLNNTTVELTVSGGCSRTEAGYGSIYGAGRAAGGATLNAGTVNVTVDNGNATTLGALYAGGYSNNGAVNATTTNVTVTSGDFAKFVAAGAQVYSSSAASTIGNTNLTITGGTFENAVLGASYAAGGASATVSETATTTISGGTFLGFVAGGGYVNASTLTVGDVDLTISGGTFKKYIFGGNISATKTESAGTQTGAVSLTLDATSNAISAGIIYAGSMNSDTVASTEVTLTGKGNNLSFSRLYGCGSYSGEQTGGVTGTKALTFTGFSGELSGKLYDFDTFTMSGSTVKLAVGQGLSAVSTWNLDLTGTGVSATKALIDWSNGGANSFANDTLNLTFDTDSTTSLLVIDGTDTDLDLALDKSGLYVYFNDVAAEYDETAKSWSLGDWTLSNVQTVVEESTINQLVLSKA